MIRIFQNNSQILSDWNYKIRTVYWLIGLLIFLSSIGSWPFATMQEHSTIQHLWKYIFVQNGLVIGILLVAELIYHMNTRWQDYAIISIGSGFAALIHGMAPIHVSGVQIVVILPILTSALYFEYRKVLFACASTLLPYLAIITFNSTYRFDVQKPVGYGLILFTTIAALGIVYRGLKIMKYEKAALINEEKYRLQQKANDEALSKDALTGLNNHRCFQERLQTAVNSERDQPLHLALIDIDNFKQVNDDYGHLTGDIVIRRIGQILKGLTNCNCFAARYGGEEFAVILSGLNSAQTEEWLEELRTRTEQTVITELGNQNITVSIGCHLLEENEDNNFLFCQADAALYRAKRNGKNQVAW
ncbi:GGDEF domain-containing protein [Paenibacillus wynnii]|uniref:GGDEF domain-containing protein n=1 Tax=Paenibacillus wynnii TaxID=268407 RepID=UPI00278CD606|nr:GGDEF domain-containing protein [Paenibacillus wynnii]MDQ0195203.1 diguanylate cyclase (GGDEF)-like protein [Paenibacillus wynnii]